MFSPFACNSNKNETKCLYLFNLWITTITHGFGSKKQTLHGKSTKPKLKKQLLCVFLCSHIFPIFCYHTNSHSPTHTHTYVYNNISLSLYHNAYLIWGMLFRLFGQINMVSYIASPKIPLNASCVIYTDASGQVQWALAIGDTPKPSCMIACPLFTMLRLFFWPV